eukprot:Sspe_Gene.9469::Locus_3180_Transcript_1_1_Confidence_1.000_Length_1769::g.9469::m.9469
MQKVAHVYLAKAQQKQKRPVSEGDRSSSSKQGRSLHSLFEPLEDALRGGFTDNTPYFNRGDPPLWQPSKASTKAQAVHMEAVSGAVLKALHALHNLKMSPLLQPFVTGGASLRPPVETDPLSEQLAQGALDALSDVRRAVAASKVQADRLLRVVRDWEGGVEAVVGACRALASLDPRAGQELLPKVEAAGAYWPAAAAAHRLLAGCIPGLQWLEAKQKSLEALEALGDLNDWTCQVHTDLKPGSRHLEALRPWAQPGRDPTPDTPVISGILQRAHEKQVNMREFAEASRSLVAFLNGTSRGAGSRKSLIASCVKSMEVMRRNPKGASDQHRELVANCADGLAQLKEAEARMAKVSAKLQEAQEAIAHDHPSIQATRDLLQLAVGTLEWVVTVGKKDAVSMTLPAYAQLGAAAGHLARCLESFGRLSEKKGTAHNDLLAAVCDGVAFTSDHPSFPMTLPPLQPTVAWGLDDQSTMTAALSAIASGILYHATVTALAHPMPPDREGELIRSIRDSAPPLPITPAVLRMLAASHDKLVASSQRRIKVHYRGAIRVTTASPQ